jgi:hypothetical protein
MGFAVINFCSAISSTYDHRKLKTGIPVRSSLLKQLTGGLVVRWVTTSESPLSYVFNFFHSKSGSRGLCAASPLISSDHYLVRVPLVFDGKRCSSASRALALASCLGLKDKANTTCLNSYYVVLMRHNTYLFIVVMSYLWFAIDSVTAHIFSEKKASCAPTC